MDGLLKLKLDMVYRSLSTEEAQKVYSELTAPAAPVEPAPAPAPAPKPKTVVRKKVKALVAKS